MLRITALVSVAALAALLWCQVPAGAWDGEGAHDAPASSAGSHDHPADEACHLERVAKGLGTATFHKPLTPTATSCAIGTASAGGTSMSRRTSLPPRPAPLSFLRSLYHLAVLIRV